MKTSMYFNYTTRSLLRGGQRTIASSASAFFSPKISCTLRID